MWPFGKKYSRKLFEYELFAATSAAANCCGLPSANGGTICSESCGEFCAE